MTSHLRGRRLCHYTSSAPKRLDFYSINISSQCYWNFLQFLYLKMFTGTKIIYNIWMCVLFTLSNTPSTVPSPMPNTIIIFSWQFAILLFLIYIPNYVFTFLDKCSWALLFVPVLQAYFSLGKIHFRFYYHLSDSGMNYKFQHCILVHCI